MGGLIDTMWREEFPELSLSFSDWSAMANKIRETIIYDIEIRKAPELISAEYVLDLVKLAIKEYIHERP